MLTALAADLKPGDSATRYAAAFAALLASVKLSMNRALSLLIGFLLVSAIYLYTFPQANVLYAGVVLLHALAGIVLSAWLLWWLLRSWRQSDFLLRAGMVLLFLGAIPGLVPA